MKGITDLEISDISDVASAKISDLNENETPIEVYTTTREIELPSTLSRSAMEESGKIYATTSVASYTDKADSDSENMNYVTAYGTIYWRDHLGYYNEFLSASGGWDPDINPSTGLEPTLSDRNVIIKSWNQSSDDEYHYFNYSTNTFNISQDEVTYYKGYHSYRMTMDVTIDGNDIFHFWFETSIFT